MSKDLFHNLFQNGKHGRQKANNSHIRMSNTPKSRQKTEKYQTKVDGRILKSDLINFSSKYTEQDHT